MISATLHRRPHLSTAVVAIVVALVAMLGPAQRADAVTADEYFIEAAHRDFLLRYPSAAEVTWWSAYIGSNSRTSMVQQLLGNSEFEQLWVVGVRYRYLGEVDTSDPSFSTDLSNLGSTGNFVAAEVSVLASSSYFSLKGSTNTAFVEGIYQDVLLRPSDPGGLSYWVGQLNAATKTRAQVANSFVRTTEAANRRVGGPSGATTCSTTTLDDLASLTAGAYCLVLDRMASPGDITYWSGQLSGTDQLPSLWASMAGSTEYYTNAQP